MNGIFEGHGLFKWDDGSSYVGEFLNGLPTGQSVYSVHDQDLVTWHGKFLEGKSTNHLLYKVK